MLVHADLRADALRSPPATTTWSAPSHLVRPKKMSALTVKCPDPNGTHTSHDIDQDTIRCVFPDLPIGGIVHGEYDYAAAQRLEFLRRVDGHACREAAKIGPVFREYLLSDCDVVEGPSLML